ncbi:hypothetical protein Mx9_p33 [Myxococcus phage Mx9]|nr:hypothetical protein Mx9_p33 [Myxococcus phage Mx9]
MALEFDAQKNEVAEAARRVTLSVSTREAVADTVSYLTGHPDAWRNTHLGHLLRVHAAPGAGRAAITEVRAALGLPETEPGALAEWSRGTSLGDVLHTLASLQAGAQ